jgi:hypothetical protein
MSNRPYLRRAGRGVFAIGVTTAMILSLAVVAGVGSAASQSAPVNAGEPVISGDASVGSSLTATQGTWSESPTAFVFQWLRCPSSGGASDGSDCAAIGGATTQAYVVASSDVGSRLRVRVTASNADGSASAVSNATGLIAAQDQSPRNTAQPTISGTARAGSTLTATQGSWSGSPTSFAYQWVRCASSGGNPDGSDCAVISGARTQAYVVSSSDVGSRLRVRVTATNASGSTTAASNATALIAAQDQRPANTSQPSISGTARAGSTLTASTGQWTNNPASYAYQWTRCPQSGGKPDASDCAAIGGATTRSYVVTASAVGLRIRVRVTAKNATGSATAASNATAVVQAAAPTPAPTGCPTGSGAIRPDEIKPPARLLIDHQSISPPVVTRGTQTLRVRFHVSACGGRSVQGMLVYVTAVPYNQFTVPAEATTGGDGWARLTMRRARSFPAAERQQLLVMFVRARKGGENLLGGISTHRLVSFRVNLSR